MLDLELFIINLIFIGEESPVEYYPTPATLFLQLAYHALVSFLIFQGSFKKIASFLFRKLAFIHSFMVRVWFS